MYLQYAAFPCSLLFKAILTYLEGLNSKLNTETGILEVNFNQGQTVLL